MNNFYDNFEGQAQAPQAANAAAAPFSQQNNLAPQTQLPSSTPSYNSGTFGAHSSLGNGLRQNPATPTAAPPQQAHFFNQQSSAAAPHPIHNSPQTPHPAYNTVNNWQTTGNNQYLGQLPTQNQLQGAIQALTGLHEIVRLAQNAQAAPLYPKVHTQNNIPQFMPPLVNFPTTFAPNLAQQSALAPTLQGFTANQDNTIAQALAVLNALNAQQLHSGNAQPAVGLGQTSDQENAQNAQPQAHMAAQSTAQADKPETLTPGAQKTYWETLSEANAQYLGSTPARKGLKSYLQERCTHLSNDELDEIVEMAKELENQAVMVFKAKGTHKTKLQEQNRQAISKLNTDSANVRSTNPHGTRVFTRSEISKMSTREFLANQAEILAQYSKGAIK